MRPGGAIRGKWRILDGKGGEWCVFIFGAPKVIAPPVSTKDRSSGPSELVRLCTDYVLTHTGFMGSCKLSDFDGP
jgi:hypothetical protein